jgi:copper homeostasis protein (lipoprotein)
MKKIILIYFSTLALFSCQEGARNTNDTKVTETDSSAIASEQAMVNELAAFYTGTLPCPDCDAIQTLLTLNADEKRTFTLEEEFKGKASRRVESTGTWTVAGDMVTLKFESSVSKFQVTEAGLISLNVDGTKIDSISAGKYLLKKVSGE